MGLTALAKYGSVLKVLTSRNMIRSRIGFILSIATLWYLMTLNLTLSLSLSRNETVNYGNSNVSITHNSIKSR